MIDEKDLPEELKGDIVPEIDPTKLFDEKEYSTIIIGGEGMTKKDTNAADYLSIIVSPQRTREEKDEALIQLKENNAQTFMLNAIAKTKKPEQKALVVAACWETGLDFSNDFPVFIDLICSNNFGVSLEAFTVIQEMESEIPEGQLKNGLELLRKVKSPNPSVLDAIELIEHKLNG